MKIQIITESFHGYMDDKISGKIFGGQELLLLETCKLLMDRGDQVEILQLSDKKETLVYEGIKIKKIYSPKLSFIERAGFVRRWTWAGLIFAPHIDRTADWIHIHNHHFSFPIRFFVRKQILTGMNHGVEWDLPWTYQKINLKNLRDRFSFFMLKAVTRFSSKRLDKLITNDRFFIHFSTSHRPHLAKKFKYIPNYVDERVFDLDKVSSSDKPEIFNKIYDFANGRKIILLPKMSMKERGTDLMLHVMNSIDDSVLVITGVSQQQDHYKNLVKEMKLENKVFFTDHLSYKDELPFIFYISDIVVVPSPCREATAISLLEAMAMQKPVIASEIGGLVEIIWHKHNGILVEPNSENFLTAIKSILSDHNLAQKLALNARRDVLERFSRERWRSSMASFFSNE
tara:strand:+ start:5536 stop:6735 length:1200 start_codon:yes stop_codon:yes gene_type:complete